ncbi:hypothetical protein HZB94_04725 [Candidatus Falkowbacteria bacterium]|nr:hypothetical protein [Candidatus Falkowbacteria bacterium]
MFLLIDTEQNNWFAVAVGEKDISRFKIVKKEFSQSELLLKTISRLLSPNGKSPNSIPRPEAIFVVQGPGAFSALRVGIATANALGFAWGAPVIGVKLKKEWQAMELKVKLKAIWETGVKAVDGQSRKIKRTEKIVIPVYGQSPNIGKKVVGSS